MECVNQISSSSSGFLVLARPTRDSLVTRFLDFGFVLVLVHLERDNKWLICLFIGAFVSERFEVSKRKCFESSGEGIIISWMLSQRLEAGLCRCRRRRRDQVIGSALGE